MCRPRVYRKVEALFGIPSMESLSRKRIDVRRVTVVDGYSGPKFTISFLKPVGSTPYFEYSKAWEEKASYLPYRPQHRVPISQELWNEVKSFPFPEFDGVKGVGGPDEDNDGEIIVCTDGYSMLNEAALPDVSGGKAKVVRSSEHTCGEIYFDALARFATRALPGCGQFETYPDDEDWISIIPVCAMLEDYGPPAVAILKTFIPHPNRVDLGSKFAQTFALELPNGESLRGPAASNRWSQMIDAEGWNNPHVWDLDKTDGTVFEVQILMHRQSVPSSSKYQRRLGTVTVRADPGGVKIERIKLGRIVN
jgi:hypothetical protein